MEKGWWSLVILCWLLVGLLNNNAYVEGLGVNWGTISSHPLPPKTVVQLLKDIGIQKVKLFDSNENILNALAGSGIEVMIAIPNLELKNMMDKDIAKAWVQHNVTRYNVTSKDGVNITFVGIGNEPFLKDYKDMFVNSTLPALTNIQNALNDAGIGNVTKAAIPFNADVYFSPSNDDVPSTGIFRPDIADTVREILKVMDKNNIPFLVNIYPFLSAYQGNGFPIEFAFFDGTANALVDTHTGIKYTNVFDAMIDTLASALKHENYSNMPIIVGEMGWPTDGDVLANVSYASRFYHGLIKHLATNKGTPLRPGYMEVYMFALFDEDGKSTLPGNFERSWGLYRYDGIPKFPLDLSGGGVSPVRNLVAAKDVEYQPKKWCQLNSNVKNKTAVQKSIDYACKSGADCTPLGDGSSCYSLNDDDKNSYAFNAYFQVNNQAPEACDFGGSAVITTTNISQPTCNFTIQIVSSNPTISPSPSPSQSTEDKGSADSKEHDKSSSGTYGACPSSWSMALALAIMSSIFAQSI